MPDDEVVEDVFDEDYFLRGLATSASCYENFRWLPEETIGMCQSLVDHLPITPGEVTLDYGCARGYVTYALTILHREAFGCDISEWATTNCHPAVKDRIARNDGLTIPWPGPFSWCLMKDILEHVPKSALDALLQNVADKCERVFIVVPLADENGEYRVRKENWDPSHKIREDVDWWVDAIGAHFSISVRHEFPDLKAAYRHVIGGHAFITGCRERE